MGILKRLFTPPEGYSSKTKLGIELRRLEFRSKAVLDKNIPYEKNDNELADLMKKEHAIGDVFVKRSLKGKAAEKAGREEAAIALYEQNVADGDEAPFPYKRLRVIYSKRKQYGQAIRVCQAYVDLLDEFDRLHLAEAMDKDHRKEAQAETEKLRKKLANSPQ